MKTEAQENEERNCQNKSSLLQHPAGVHPVEQRETTLSESKRVQYRKITANLKN